MLKGSIRISFVFFVLTVSWNIIVTLESKKTSSRRKHNFDTYVVSWKRTFRDQRKVGMESNVMLLAICHMHLVIQIPLCTEKSEKVYFTNIKPKQIGLEIISLIADWSHF